MRLKSRLRPGCTLKELADRYKDRLDAPLSGALAFALSPRAYLRQLSDGFWLRWAIKDVQVFGNYAIVPLTGLSRQQKQETEKLLHGCHGYRPAACRQGIAMLRHGKVVGAWEFDRLGGMLNLVALSATEKEQRQFIQENHSSMAEAMFRVLLEYCRLRDIERISYFRANSMFRMMMLRFQRSGYIAGPEGHNGGTAHRILPDEWQ